MIWGTQYCFYLTCFAGTVIVMFDFPLSCTTYLYWSAFKATGFDLELKMITNIQGYLYSISKKIALQVFLFHILSFKKKISIYVNSHNRLSFQYSVHSLFGTLLLLHPSLWWYNHSLQGQRLLAAPLSTLCMFS